MTARTIRVTYSTLLIILFMALLTAPAIKMSFSDRMTFSPTEKRALSVPPAFPDSLKHLDSFFSEIALYLDDHFGFREFLIYRYQREIRKRFGQTGNESNTHKGVDNWYFFGQSEMLLDFTGMRHVSETRVKKWVSDYHAKKQWLQEQGIRYLLVIAPNKQSVYPEYVMEAWQRVQGKSKLQQLITAYPEISNTELLDLATPLKAKKTEPLFFKSDTHWTPFGAYTSFLSIAEKLEQMFPSLTLNKDFGFTGLKTRTCSPSDNQCGDLTKMLLDFQPFKESFRGLSKYETCARFERIDYPLSNYPARANKSPVTVTCSEAQLKAVIFRDSFFVGLEPYFSENFSRAVYLWKEYDQSNVEEIQKYFTPDIVIEEVVERILPLE